MFREIIAPDIARVWEKSICFYNSCVHHPVSYHLRLS